MFWKMKNLITRQEDDTISESESSDSDGENSYVEESFEVLFVPEEDIQHNKLGIKEPMRGGSRGGGVDLTIISR